MTHDEAILHLADFASGRIADPALRHAIAGHVVDCEDCLGVVAVAEDVERIAAAEPDMLPRARPVPAAPARWLTAAAFLVAASGLWWGLWAQRTAASRDQVAQATVFPADAGPLRGPGEAPSVDVWVRDEQGRVVLVFGLTAAEPITGARLQVAPDGGPVVWSADAGILRPEGASVWVTASIPAHLLESGAYSMTLSAGGAAIATRRFRVLRLR